MKKLTSKEFREKLIKQNEQYRNKKLWVNIEDYNGTHKKILCKCLVDNQNFDTTPHNLLLGQGCPVCANKVIIKGINDIATTRPDLFQYFVNKEDAYKYAKNSHQKVDIECPCCKFNKKIVIQSLNNNGFRCPKCSDSISYAEKFMFSFLEQLDCEYIYQLSKTTFEWCNKYYYDFYLPKYNAIIEVHGGQHYIRSFERMNGRTKTLEEEQDNDKRKEKLAKDNGIKNYIVIDCRKSDMYWIKESILNSNLNYYFNLNNIDWGKCELDAANNLLYKISELRNNHFSVKKIAELIHMNEDTIRRYLKKGTMLGLCNYDGAFERDNHMYCCHETTRIKVVCLNKETSDVICVYNSATEASIDVSGSDGHSNVLRCISGKQYNGKTYRTCYGYKWESLENYLLKNPNFDWEKYLKEVKR